MGCSRASSIMLQMWAHLFLSAVCFLEDGPTALAHDMTIAGQTADTSTSSISSQPTTISSLRATPQHPQLTSIPVPGSTFILKVLVTERVSGQRLNRATVEVFVNYSRTDTALTGEDGVVWLHLPYRPGITLSAVASKEGYLPSPLPWRTTKMPIFSSVTLSLLSLTQGDVWLFEDSVLITARSSGTMLQPSVQFPKHLLNLSDSDIISSVRAYLTVPKLTTGRDGRTDTLGLRVGRFGYSSVELSAVVGVSVELRSSQGEIQVSGGPVQISLPLPDSSELQADDAVPAWSFHHDTGAWMNRGSGVVKTVEGKRMWTYNASHLGYWIAAPSSSPRGYSGLAIPIDFISQHASFIAAILGGTLVLLIGVVAVLLCCRRTSPSRTKVERNRSMKTAVSKTDQTTSTSDDAIHEASNSRQPEDWSKQGARRVDCGNFNIRMEDSGLADIQFYRSPVDAESEYSASSRHYPPRNATSAELTNSLGVSEGARVPPLTVNEGIFFQDDLVHLCNQSLAMLHASGLFHFPEQPPWSESASSHHLHPEAAGKASFTQTQPRDPLLCQPQRGPGGEGQTGGRADPHGPPWGRYNNLAESVSVPVTLHNMSTRGPHAGLQGTSEQGLTELSKLPAGKSPSHQPPRAWFVSLEGKPAAEIHHCVTPEAQRRHGGPADGHDTSLDSGVDMSEPSQQAGRRVVQLQRERTFVKSPDEPAEPSRRGQDKL